MNKRRQYCFGLLFFALLFFVPSFRANASVTSISISAPKSIIGYRQNMRLTANVKGASADDKITWTSSNKAKATVDENGVVTGTGAGKVTITAHCGGKSDSISMLAVHYTPSNGIGGGDLAIYYDGNKKRVFRTYSRGEYNGSYGKKRGQAVAATATVLSATVNFFITPDTVHKGSNHYSEEYAIRKLGKEYSKQDVCPPARRLSTLNNVTPTNRMVTRILLNSGLSAKYVRTVTSDSYQEIYNHLANGNMVMFTCNNSRRYKGITLSSSTAYNTLVMAGLDENGKVLLINPVSGSINYSHVQKKNFHFTVSEIVKNYIRSATSTTKFYSGDYKGYILVYAPKATTKVNAMRISRNNLKLDKGDKYSLDAFINPATVDQNVTWVSSNEEVATVSSNGTITALAPGTTDIKAVSVADDSFSATCNVIVYPGQVSSVKVTAPVTRVGYGKRLKLSAIIEGGTKNDEVFWYSSNRNKATVDQNGYVTGQGGGFVEITAKVGSKSDSITILAQRYSPRSVDGDTDVTIWYNGNQKRTYPSYSQAAYNGSYGGHRGCAITSTAIVLSGMIDPSITPRVVHQGIGRYSEKYAIKKLGTRYTNYDTISGAARIAKINQSTPTNRMLAEILGNAGLKVKYVRDITSSSATEIYLSLARGNPVIFTTKSTLNYKGISLAKTWHTLVMVGLDENGKAIVINPAGGKVNYSHAQGAYFHFTVKELVDHFERDCAGGTQYYSGSRYGYIIVSK